MRQLLLVAAFCISLPCIAQKKQITLEDVWRKNTFRIKSVPGFNALSDGKRFTKIDMEGDRQVIRVYNLESGKQLETLFDNDLKYEGNTINVDNYAFSNNEQQMLLKTESENIYRRSVLNKVYVYDIKSRQLKLADEGKVLHASLSPDGSKLAYVKDNNLYYKDLKSGNTVAITTDGKRNEIINGNCDWVYEEEFEFTQAYQWAPDGKHIAFYRFDERQVPEYTMTVYDSLYPTPYKYKYPKAGEPNSIVEIKVYDLNSRKTVSANIGSEKDQYIPRIKWTNDPNSLCIYRMNRHQNKLELLLANASTGKSSVIYSSFRIMNPSSSTASGVATIISIAGTGSGKSLPALRKESMTSTS